MIRKVRYTTLVTTILLLAATSLHADGLVTTSLVVHDANFDFRGEDYYVRMTCSDGISSTSFRGTDSPTEERSRKRKAPGNHGYFLQGGNGATRPKTKNIMNSKEL